MSSYFEMSSFLFLNSFEIEHVIMSAAYFILLH